MAEKRSFKTSKQLTIAKMYRAWDDYEVGDVLIGTIIGSHYDAKYTKKWGPILKVEDAQFKTDSAKFTGKNLVLNPAGMLIKALSTAGFDPLTGKLGESENCMIQVTYNGKNMIEKGQWAGKESHTMDVQLVEEDNGDDHGSDEGEEEGYF
jgi:hypothetical protein